MKMDGMALKIIAGVMLILVIAGGYMVLNSIGNQTPAPSPSPTFQVSTLTPTPVATKPVVNIIELIALDCRDCFAAQSLGVVLEQNGADVKVDTYDYKSVLGKEAIEKYKIKKIPTVIVSGELEKFPELLAILNKSSDIVEGRYVLRDIAPPYYDFDLAKFVGKVKFTTIYSTSCFYCKKATVPINGAAINATLLAPTLATVGVGIESDLMVDSNSSEGIALIKKYKIMKLPAIIVSNDIEAYPEFKQAFSLIWTNESDGNYLLRELNPPFQNITTGKDEGMVSIVYIKAGTRCPECYDYTLHKGALARLGVVPAESFYYDFDSEVGRNYTSRYNITKIPTWIISPGIKDFPAFMFVSKQLGEFKEDGYFVFGKQEVIGDKSYFDIALNKSVPISQIQISGQGATQ